VESLPKLCWCAAIERGVAEVVLTCGPWVESREDAFVEGAWDAPFEDFGFTDSQLLMGSGGVVSSEFALFATPSHNMEWLSVIRGSDRLWISNSLVFALSEANLELDPGYLDYGADIQSAQLGLSREKRHIPTQNGPDVELVRYANLRVDAELNVERLAKPDVPPFPGFSDYRGYLAGGLRGLDENARSEARRIRYEWMSTLSSGYDSNGAAALASEVGSKRAISSDAGYSTAGRREPDSGAEVGEALGFEVEVRTLSPDMLTEAGRAEFAACGDIPELILFAFQDQLGAKILTTGNSGGYWGVFHGPTSDLGRPDAGGAGLGELRIRVGFIHLPVPAFGAVRHPDVHAINGSEEMKPWCVDDFYNRPFPRRVLEEMGVPRELFGQTKKGAPVVGDVPAGLRDYYAKHRSASSPLQRLVRNLRYRYTRLARRVDVALLNRRQVSQRELWSIAPPGPLTVVVPWGVEATRDRYRH
jgi:hypothetical protein